MNRMNVCFILAYLSLPLNGNAQEDSVVFNQREFLGVTVGLTKFAEVAPHWERYAYAKPIIRWRSIKWRDGGHSMLWMHDYFLKIGKDKLQVSLVGYGTVDAIRIQCNGATALKYKDLTLGKTRVEELEFDQSAWELRTDADKGTFLAREYEGILIEVPGVLSDTIQHRESKLFKTRIKQVKISKNQ
jgi:hypothetical protein